MSGLYDYKVAEQLVANGAPFDALIMAAAMCADTRHHASLVGAFPALIAEAKARYNAPGGKLASDGA